jgi:chromosomal replication initiator protein
MTVANTISSISKQEYGESIWSNILLSLKKFVNADQFQTCLDDTKFLELTDNTLIISSKTHSTREWLIKNYFIIIKKELLKIDPIVKKLSILVDQTEQYDFIASNSELNRIAKQNIFSRLNSKFNFKNYITGESNYLAYKMSLDIASQNISYNHNNIFYIYSHVGMGKTHLLQSIASEIENNHKEEKVGYLSAEKFMHNFVNAVKNNKLFELRNKINGIETFIIDDLHFICGKESTQKEFALILNSLIESGKTVVIASSFPPHMLELIDTRTKSLLISSNTIHIQPLDYALRLKVLQHYNNNNNMKFDDRILTLIAEKITTNVRELEAALNNLTTYLTLSGKKPLLYNIHNYIQNYMRSSVKKVTVESIINGVAKFYKTSKSDILSKKRTKKLVLSRQIISYLAKELTSDSLKLIGERLGNRNHATILYYLAKFKKLTNIEQNIMNDVNLIKTSIVI